ncbi:sugar O-acetyltransferase [Staphylococcus auricularis]|uniref:Maltose acetyltransferase n=1 Tax=Staphylococcus auricularis TaxID=29379 RepID=A0ABX5IFK8_9STAP|nr:sugar O-acetyltransferase [Staphylococcus auricularis]MCE5038851.1 sugar O-acetyltransferase [Staphylococcus auricularis]MEB6570653.1 sugar O-acetyltransferase [Staphylococcus auricularis]PTH18907.1 maltose acetyltransferase [Staphylococcus auricularis]PTH24617.1 maltose acetyltransferase [Staphylococcus auricularis]
MTEWQKMIQGEWYQAAKDPSLQQARLKAKDLCFEYNQTKPSDIVKRDEILARLFKDIPIDLELLAPFQVDYGSNISIGEGVFINHDCYFMDCAPITIGNHVLIGPRCGLYTAHHPLRESKRRAGIEQARPITIHDNVWLGANVVVVPGVTIGKGAVIGAGSVVTKDVPDYTLAVGVPAQVVQSLEEDEK